MIGRTEKLKSWSVMEQRMNGDVDVLDDAPQSCLPVREFFF